jgi:hypothetical protein
MDLGMHLTAKAFIVVQNLICKCLEKMMRYEFAER